LAARQAVLPRRRHGVASVLFPSIADIQPLPLDDRNGRKVASAWSAFEPYVK
jgi:hypothetical protein